MPGVTRNVTRAVNTISGATEQQKSPHGSGHNSLSFVINPAFMTQVSNISAAFAITLRNQVFRSPTGSTVQAEIGEAIQGIR